MKKYEFVAAVAEETGLTQKQVTAVVEAFGKVIVDECVGKGEEVNLPSLGKFKQKVNAAREGMNPLTKTPMHVKESHTLKFTPSAAVKVIILPSKAKTAKKAKK